MPTYDYKCEACGNQFEKFQSIKAAPIRKCPKCGKNKVKRLIGTGAGMIFKGSGFYITDYRSESYKSAAKADSGGGSGDSKGESKKDSGGSTNNPASKESKPATAPAPAAKSKAPEKKK